VSLILWTDPHTSWANVLCRVQIRHELQLLNEALVDMRGQLGGPKEISEEEMHGTLYVMQSRYI
jgi:hypothetical protein